MDEPPSAELDALQWLRHEQALREAELNAVKYEAFTVRQEIAGHRLYPQTDEVRAEITHHERRLAELKSQEAALAQKLAEISDRIRRIRDTIEAHH